VKGVVTSELKCPVCESNCQVIKEHLVFFGNSDWTLFECSNDTCGELVLRRSGEVMRVNVGVLHALYWNNGGAAFQSVQDDAIRIQTEIDRLAAERTKIDQQSAQKQKDLEFTNETIAKLDSEFWHGLFNSVKKSPNPTREKR